MCGIGGWLAGSGRIADGAALVTKTLNAQSHRGPDAHGLLTIGATILGHRRLSILDLSDAGRQPMTNERGDVAITFNGEINT